MNFEILTSENSEVILRVFGPDEWDEIDDALNEEGIEGYSFVFNDTFVDFIFPSEFTRSELDIFLSSWQ